MPQRIALLGGGLHNQLLALRLLAENPAVQLTLWEKAERLPGDRTISCHAKDVPPQWEKLLNPFWAARWPHYQVRFDSSLKHVPLAYQTLSLDGLARHLESFSETAPQRLSLRLGQAFNEPAASLLEEGYDLVVDSRPARPNGLHAGVQQFLGRVYELDKPHGVKEPVIMDATVPQLGGFCFVYILPLSDHRVLIEDTRLLAHAQPESAFESGLKSYLQKHFPAALSARVEHEEKGKIPIPLSSFDDWTMSDRDLSQTPGLIRLGAHAGFFHPTTGYSLPLALRSAQRIAESLATPAPPHVHFQTLSQLTFDTRAWRHAWAAALLFNRFLLWGFRPQEAHHAFSYFYDLPLPFITRFYAAELRLRDLKIILTRLPPKRFRLFAFLRRLLGFSRTRLGAQARSPGLP